MVQGGNFALWGPGLFFSFSKVQFPSTHFPDELKKTQKKLKTFNLVLYEKLFCYYSNCKSFAL